MGVNVMGGSASILRGWRGGLWYRLDTGGAVDEARGVGEGGASALRKVSWRLVPLIGLGYGAAYMDRVNISFAAVQMNQDLHFSATMYALGAGLFFVSYGLCEVPSNVLLVRFGARRWLSRIMLTWGLIAMGMMLVKTPREFYAMRFLLGMAEAGFFPGVVYYLTEWFPPEWRARAISRFYVALPLSSTVMGSLAGWLLGLNGRLGLRGWQWLFVLEGLPPLVLSVVFWRYLPDTPADAGWLLPEERRWLEARLAEARVGVFAGSSDGAPVWATLGLVVRDRRVLMLAGVYLCQLTVLYAWAFSAPVILEGLTGWGIGGVGRLIAGLGLAGAATMLWTASRSDRTGERTWHIAVPFLLMAVGYTVGGLSGRPWVGVTAFGFAVVAYNALQGPMLMLPSTFFSGKTSAIGYAALNAVGIGGGFVGPAFMGWARDFTGGYQRGLLALAVPCVVAAGLVWGLGRVGSGAADAR
jgi:ACS family tartrate transporter-like MFS transporter